MFDCNRHTCADSLANLLLRPCLSRACHSTSPSSSPLLSFPLSPLLLSSLLLDQSCFTAWHSDVQRNVPPPHPPFFSTVTTVTHDHIPPLSSPRPVKNCQLPVTDTCTIVLTDRRQARNNFAQQAETRRLSHFKNRLPTLIEAPKAPVQAKMNENSFLRWQVKGVSK